jgi:TPR repeat protein
VFARNLTPNLMALVTPKEFFMDDPWDANGNFTDIGMSFNENFDWTTKLEQANSGNANAQYQMGVWHLDGENSFVEINKEKAIEWLTKSAGKENEKAKKVLEQISQLKERPEHLKCYICLAGLENYSCFNNCDKTAELHRKEEEERQKYEEQRQREIEQRRKEAEHGDAQAQFKAGCDYEDRFNPQKDFAKAAEWYLKSAEQGYVKAEKRLGFFYDEGMGVSQDEAKAVEWYLKAAEQGDAEAQCKLGHHYHKGEGVTKDLDKAAEWYQKAADQGDTTAQYFRNEVRKERKWNW